MSEPEHGRLPSQFVESRSAVARRSGAAGSVGAVFLGPNGSGKSTIFDVMAFLSECFSEGLKPAWSRRGRCAELRSRDASGPIVIELKYRERPKTPLITYHLAISEERDAPIVEREWLSWKRLSYGKPCRFLSFERGVGEVTAGDVPDERAERIRETLASPRCLGSEHARTVRSTPSGYGV
jgi:predicted ATPase